MRVNKDMTTINDILDKVRKGEIKGKVEFEINDKGKIKKITVAPHDAHKEISDSIEKVKAEAKDISGADFSKTNLSGDLSGMDLKGTNFSYARIEGADLSGSNLKGASFQKAEVSETDMKNSYSVDMRGAYLTGSVDLYGVQESPAMTDVYKPSTDVPKNYKRYSYGRGFQNIKESEAPRLGDGKYR